MITKAEIGNVRLYLFWSLLKIPRFFSITGNCKQKIWLKQPKAASALDFSYFQHASKLVTHHNKSPEAARLRDFSFAFYPLFYPLTVLSFSIDSAPHIGFHAVRTVLFHFFGHMTIHVQRKRCRCVPQIRLHGFHIIAILEAQNCDLLFFYDSIIRRQSKSKQMKSKADHSQASQYFRSKIKIFIMIILTIVQNRSIIVKKRWFGDCHE